MSNTILDNITLLTTLLLNDVPVYEYGIAKTDMNISMIEGYIKIAQNKSNIDFIEKLLAVKNPILKDTSLLLNVSRSTFMTLIKYYNIYEIIESGFLDECIIKGKILIIIWLFEIGVGLNIKLRSRYYKNITPSMLVIIKYKDLFLKLDSSKADLTLVDSYGNTALHYAIMKEKIHVVEYFYKNKITIESSYGNFTRYLNSHIRSIPILAMILLHDREYVSNRDIKMALSSILSDYRFKISDSIYDKMDRRILNINFDDSKDRIKEAHAILESIKKLK